MIHYALLVDYPGDGDNKLLCKVGKYFASKHDATPED
jgi:hypothetical protein